MRFCVAFVSIRCCMLRCKSCCLENGLGHVKWLHIWCLLPVLRNDYVASSHLTWPSPFSEQQDLQRNMQHLMDTNATENLMLHVRLHFMFYFAVCVALDFKIHKSLHILLQTQVQHDFLSVLVACLWFLLPLQVGNYQKEENPTLVFHHIPKCGSSSTSAMTSDLEIINFKVLL